MSRGPPEVAVPVDLARLPVPSVHSAVFGLSNRSVLCSVDVVLRVDEFNHFLRAEFSYPQVM